MTLTLTITLIGICRVVTVLAGAAIGLGGLAIAFEEETPWGFVVCCLGAFLLYAGIVA